MQTYFVEKIKDKRVYLFESDKNHIKKVMRMKINDQIKVVWETRVYLAQIKSIDPLFVDVIEEIFVDSELKQQIDLFQASIKPNNFEWIVQKACEMQVNSIYQLILERTYNHHLIKEQRIKTIIKEACEQSRRQQITNYFSGFSFSDLLNKINEYDLVLIAYENQKQQKISDLIIEWKQLQKIAIIIGGEGGFSFDEINLLQKYKNVVLVSLTKTILRSETASFYVLANIVEKLN